LLITKKLCILSENTDFVEGFFMLTAIEIILVIGAILGALFCLWVKRQKIKEKLGSFEYSDYLCNNNKRKESYMETKDKKIQVHTIDYKDIDKFFPARSEITMSPLPKGHIARLATINKVKVQ